MPSYSYLITSPITCQGANCCICCTEERIKNAWTNSHGYPMTSLSRPIGLLQCLAIEQLRASDASCALTRCAVLGLGADNHTCHDRSGINIAEWGADWQGHDRGARHGDRRYISLRFVGMCASRRV